MESFAAERGSLKARTNELADGSMFDLKNFRSVAGFGHSHEEFGF